MILKDIINKHEPVKAACEDTKYTKNTKRLRLKKNWGKTAANIEEEKKSSGKMNRSGEISREFRKSGELVGEVIVCVSMTICMCALCV